MEGTVHLCFWLDFATMGMRLLSACAVKGTSGVPCSLQRNELEAKHRKLKGRVVLRGDTVKGDSGSYAVFTEQGSSAS